MQDNKTPYLKLPLPDPDNFLQVDVHRLIESLQILDVAAQANEQKLGKLKERGLEKLALALKEITERLDLDETETQKLFEALVKLSEFNHFEAMTLEEYDDLPDSKLTDGVLRLIFRGGGG